MINRFPELFAEYKKLRYAQHKETQDQIAKRWDISPTTLSRYANGYIRAFPLDLIRQVCQDMDVTPNDLFWLEDE